MRIPQSIGRHNDEHATIPRMQGWSVTINEGNGGMQSTSWSQVPVDLWHLLARRLLYRLLCRQSGDMIAD